MIFNLLCVSVDVWNLLLCELRGICSFIYLGCAQLGCAGVIVVLFAFPCYIALIETEGPDPPQNCPLSANAGESGGGGGVTGS